MRERLYSITQEWNTVNDEGNTELVWQVSVEPFADATEANKYIDACQKEYTGDYRKRYVYGISSKVNVENAYMVGIYPFANATAAGQSVDFLMGLFKTYHPEFSES